MRSAPTLQKHFCSAPNVAGPSEATELGSLCATIHRELIEGAPDQYELKTSVSPAYIALKKQPQQQARVARFLFENRHHIIRPLKTDDTWFHNQWPGYFLFVNLMRANLQLEADKLLDWIIELKEDTRASSSTYPMGYENWPIGFMMQQVERKAKKRPLPDAALEKLRTISNWPEMTTEPGSSYYGTDFGKVGKRIEAILRAHDGTSPDVVPYKKLSGDQFGAALERKLALMDHESAIPHHQLMNHAASAAGGKPTQKFERASTALKTDLGKEWLRTTLQDYLGHAVTAKVVEVEVAQSWGGQRHTWVDETVFTKSNTILLKGLVWMAVGYRDAKTVNLIADLCEKSMRKIPGVGPAAQAVANACLHYLEGTPGAEATARLARLATAIKQKSVQKRVADIVIQKAEAAGITTLQLQERVVPTYGLDAGEKSVAFDDYTLQIKVEGPGKISQSWIKPDGSAQKSKPKFVGEKAALKAKFDTLKAEMTNLKKVLMAQRDRIDLMFAEDLEWPLEEVMQYYLTHGLISTLATRLIWSLNTKGHRTAALFHSGAWQDVNGAPVETDDTTTVRMWHPVDHDTTALMTWRERMTALEISQPCKQAYREIYLLTDAERITEVYSNRMAAHILKQHQMSTLMAMRGWRYQLMGAYDDGLDDQWAHKTFVTCDLQAEYLIHTNWEGENYNDAGIYTYVGTDQLRFTRGDEPVALETVPTRLLSETMREADLFVGMASVGNDPSWLDQGPTPAARTYWHDYSFGVLGGFAQTRKEVLETLIPRLKFWDVAHIDGKFLIVDGKLNTYKIHFGSSNILMAPGDRYLCIVPRNVTKTTAVSLPFEGDNRLSVILSKALMLADDDKITARDIVGQLHH